ncbi:MAG TPA: substrate-binding domain-containing protein, partial [Micromonosporaceae bacterium]|nr:substrate-binding domain-containing protein [Micromonosporaceae bacterium]
MAYGRPANVRSHRRGGPRRRLNVAPWIVVSVVVALVASGLTGGYLWLIKQSCSGSVKATVLASPGTASILEGLGREWATSEPAVDGKCASVDVASKDSADVAIALQNAWDPKVNGPAPDAWVPQSTAWVRKAANDADAERLIPDRQPSIARSPTVIAMPKPMAEKLGWPKKELHWQDVLQTLAAKKDGWAGYGQPDWGPFRFGMTDPARSTAGLLALTAILDADDDEEISDEEQQGLLKLKQSMAVYAERTEEILNEYAKQAETNTVAGLKYISAFPALEQDVLAHNLRHPKAPLVAIYPDNSIEADHPFLVLQNAPWTRPDAQKVVTEFMAYVRGATGERELLDAGFRDPNRVPGKDLTVQNGVAPQITALPRAGLLPDSVSRAINTWTALTRPTNVLLVLDVSGSMKEKVPGFGKTRLELAKKAASDAVSLFSDDAHVGLWVFSSAQQGTKDYRVVTPLDRLGDDTGGGRTRRAQMLQNIAELQAKNDTGLYDT